jgi:catechol 2,3-dioxygenase-like lactoylglutathione lyase family enzyme
MDLSLRRIILFTPNMDEMTAFYRDVMGLKIAGREKGWVDFDAGGCALALHAGKSVVGKRSPKISFYVKDVAAARATLGKRGLALSKVISTDVGFDMCGGKDPDGNVIAISSRK